MCPYLDKYTDLCKKYGIEYEIICWNRNPQKTSSNTENNIYVFVKDSREEKHPILKLGDFISFSLYATKVIKERKYSKLIILTSLTAVFLSKILLKEYRGKYIFDYRDASYEYITGYRMLLEKIIKYSSFTCISSRGFITMLPKSENYIMAHNFKYNDLKYRAKEPKIQKKKDTINVSYLGLLREKKYLYKMVDLFSRDKRFLLYFHGDGECLEDTKNYAKNYENIIFTGKYIGDEKFYYMDEADIMCSNYESSFINNNAVSNKYYDALIHNIPLLGNPNTYLGRMIEDQDIGISLDLNDQEFTEKLYNYYLEVDRVNIFIRTQKILDNVLTEDSKYLSYIKEFLIN